jgi:hypothetical protein
MDQSGSTSKNSELLAADGSAHHLRPRAASNFLNSLFSDKQRLAPEETLWEVVSGF